MQQTFVALRTGNPGKLKPPVAGYLDTLGPGERAMVDNVLSCSAIGSPDKVRAQVEDFVARTGADELMITSQIYDHQARLNSYRLLAEAFSPVPA
jgi:alkanesulfonate monooxygenase SsuD/methylene tetrahydromethanopterin reductase-like flavin-dependent oxidoreductase (luciferase family)